jgi:two-component system NarL family sensor kinase
MNKILKVSLVICTLLFLVGQNVFSQVAKRDSLYSCLKQELSEDENIKLFLEIARLNFELKNDSSIYYCNKALSISNGNNELTKKFNAEIYGTLAQAFENVNKEQSIMFFNKSLSLYKEKGNFSKIYESHIRLCIVYTSINDLGKAETHLGEAKRIYQTSKLEDKNYQLEFATSIYWYTAQNFSKASKAYIDLIRKLETTNKYRRLSQAYLNLGACYYYLNQSDSCVNTCYKAIKLDDKHKFMQPAFRIIFLNTIAASYLQINRLEDARSIFIQNIDIAKKANITYSLIVAYNNYAYTCRLLEEYEESLRVLEIAANLIDENKYVTEKLEIDTGIGESLLRLNRIKESIPYIRKALKSAKIHSNSPLLIDNNLNLGEALNNHQSIIYYRKALKIAEKNKLNEQAFKCYEKIIQSFITDEYNKDLSIYYDKLLSLKDSIHKSSQFLKIEEIETKYETEKKEKEIELLRVEDERNQLEITKSKQLNYAMMSGIGLFLLILIPSSLFLRQKQKSKLLLERIAAEETESSRIAKELHDGIASQLTYVHSYICKQGENNDLAQVIKDARDGVRAISHKLNIGTLTKLSFKEALYDGLNLAHWDPDIDVKIALKPNNMDVADENVKRNTIRIIQELMANSLKHSQASEVSLELVQKDTRIKLSYQDNGIGFDMDKVIKGHGFQNIDDRVKSISGKIEYQSVPNEGVKVDILI